MVLLDTGQCLYSSVSYGSCCVHRLRHCKQCTVSLTLFCKQMNKSRLDIQLSCVRFPKKAVISESKPLCSSTWQDDSQTCICITGPFEIFLVFVCQCINTGRMQYGISR